jgi:23S rRNA (cytosine1962-C5)-methyltransferase
LDRYAGTFVVKIYTAAWLPHLEQTLGLFTEIHRPETVVLRLSRNIHEAARGRGLVDGQVMRGRLESERVVFLEHGLRFEADVVRGQKTGFFLDQRDNRRQVGEMAAGRDVLNAFSFSGGFSLYAARGGARQVTDLDISQHALDSARRNFALNRTDPQVGQARHETIQADTFEWLEQNGSRRFDLIIVDPPSMARREAERAGALHAYARLALGGARLLRPGGILVAASCSAHVSAAEFFPAVRAAVRQAGRRFEEIQSTGHPPDHAARFAEGEYLKCIYLKLP